VQRQRISRRLTALAIVTVGGALAASGCGDRTHVSFAREIQPIFDKKCTSCHPSSYPQLDLRPGLSHAELIRVPAATNLAFQRVLPGRPELSFLLTHNPDPLLRDLVTDDERETMRRWILEGAVDDSPGTTR
jgi:hypothetical protein